MDQSELKKYSGIAKITSTDRVQYKIVIAAERGIHPVLNVYHYEHIKQASLMDEIFSSHC